MLILTRKPGESIYIGDIKVTVVEMKGSQVRVGIDAPPEVRIYREEIYLAILEENRKAAAASLEVDEEMDEALEGWGTKPTLGALRGSGARSGKSLSTAVKSVAPQSKAGQGPADQASSGGPEVIRRRKKQTD